MLPPLTVLLDMPPSTRWEGLRPQASHARALVESYARDLGGVERLGPLLEEYAEAFVSSEHREELAAVAALLGLPLQGVLLANLYYDALKAALMGCTAFAVDTPVGPLHARNLDWWTEGRLLATATQRVELRGGRARSPVTIVGWPGFVGALSGVAHGRFAVTLNAVLSEDPPGLAEPMTLLLREVLETARSFDEAVERLTRTPVASDSLLLVTGVRPGERVVVERAPSRAAQRRCEQGPLIVTNSYRALSGEAGAASALARTACTRFQRASALLQARPPGSAEDCFAVLEDPAVRMEITVQHMVLCAATGAVQVRLPAGD